MTDRKATENLAVVLILNLSRVLVVEFILGFIVWYFLTDGLKDPSGTPLGADFINVYAAGFMANHHQSPLVYDWVIHGHAEQTITGYASPYFGWHYPPMFLAVAGPLALLPYFWAFALYMAASFAAYWAVIRRIAPQAKEYLWALVAFPGVFDNIVNGQNGFITTSLFGAGLMWLEEQPWLAGAMFGLLSYKPQFFVVIPLMLAVGGYGRALLSTLSTASAAFLLSYAVYGATTWNAFFDSTKITQHLILEQGSTGWQKIQSVFSMARMWGAEIPTAYILQSIIAVTALAVTAWIWRQKATLATLAAALCACMLLTTPYLLDYDLVILAVPLAFLIRQGIENSFKPYEKITLFGLWLLPLFARNLGNYYLPLTPPLLIALLALCIARTSEKKPI